MKTLKFPLARITVWFILGLLAGFCLTPFYSTALICLVCALLLFTTFYIAVLKSNIPKYYFDLTAYLLFFCIGISTYSFNNEKFIKHNYSHLIDNQEHLVCLKIQEKIKSNAFSYRYFAKVLAIDSVKTSGKIAVTLRHDGQPEKWQIGDKVSVYSKINAIQKPANPDQFNYKNYLEHKSVFGQLYLDSKTIQKIYATEKSMWYYAAIFRTKALQELEKSGFEKNELSIVAAYVLGQQQEISKEILKDYQFAGAIHILAVSGLHIGILMTCLELFLRPIPNTRAGNLAKLILIISLLWAFALIAGLLPSVTRAVVMFSFVAIGKYSLRKTNIYHTLLVSIFFILLFEPSFIFDVGFQLSYLAIFFIVWLQPIFSSVWKPKYYISKEIWDILTVSLAAQIGVLPLSLYYFHQFPGLFFLTNLMILPFSGIILGLGIVVILLAFWGIVPAILSQILQYSIIILNYTVNWIASFESFVLQDIFFNWQLLIASYAFIFSLFIWIKKRGFSRFILALLGILCLQATYFATLYTHQHIEEWIVYHLKSGSLFSERKGNRVWYYSNNEITDDDCNFVLKPYLVSNFIISSKTVNLKNVYYFKNQKILVIDSLGIFPKNANPDILIITNSPKINLDRTFQQTALKIVIADGSNYKNYVEMWKKTCEKQKIPFHAIAEKGFYKLN